MSKVIKTALLSSLFFMLVSFMSLGKEPIGKITFPLNRVFLIPSGSSHLKMVHFNMDVFPGDKIETKRESRCEITMRNGDVTRIDESSIYTLEQVEITEKSVKASTFLSIGKLWATIRKIFSEDDYVQVKSPSAVIAVRGTIYRLDVKKDSTTQVRVYDGEVQVSPNKPEMGGLQQPQMKTPSKIGPPSDVPGPRDVAGPRDVSVREWLEIVKAQQQLLVKPDGSVQKTDFDLVEDAKSDWVQWNKKRDELLGR